MRRLAAIAIIVLFAARSGSAQSGSGFTGTWKLNPARSEINGLPSQPDAILKVTQSAAALTVSSSAQETGPFVTIAYPLPSGAPNSRIEKVQVKGISMGVSTKWEGSSLLVTSAVSEPQNYSILDHWRESRDENTVTIRRTIVRMRGESESTLIYERVGSEKAEPAITTTAAPTEPRSAPVETASATISARPSPVSVSSGPVDDYVVDSGTRILLRLTSAVNTKQAAPGDRVHLETVFPIASKGDIVIPVGSYVTGTVIEAERAGRVKGRASLNLRFETLTLPNGTTRDFRARAGDVEGKGDVGAKEGKIEADGNGRGDARKVGETTAAGAGVGTIAGAATGHYGLGAGIGAAAGAAAGLAGVMMARGQDVVLPRGTTMELVLDRDLRFTPKEIGQSAK